MITNMDQDHYYSLMQLMKCGYDILVEKPIVITEVDLEEIDKKQSETGCRIMVCHVLRYVPFFEKLISFVQESGIVYILGQGANKVAADYMMRILMNLESTY